MAIKSTNIQGNPYHDEQTGEFTSPNNGNNKTEKTLSSVPKNSQQSFESTKISEQKPNISSEKKPFNKFKLKGNIEDIRNNLSKSKQVSSIPFLSSAYDIEEHIEEFFTDEIINNIDSKFGKFVTPYKYYNLRTDPNQRCGVNIFAACIGKKRWLNNYLKIIDWQEYSRLSNSFGFSKLYRGLRGNDEQFKTIANSYSSKENEMIYGSVGGTAYGIAVYASNYRNEAIAYADYNKEHVMDLILNTRAKTMSYRQICNIRDDLNRRLPQIESKVENLFIEKGIERTKAKTMARSFGITLGDEGFVAMLCGVEWYSSGSYHMIENLGAMYRLLK